jgi:hypothetical protein
MEYLCGVHLHQNGRELQAFSLEPDFEHTLIDKLHYLNGIQEFEASLILSDQDVEGLLNSNVETDVPKYHIPDVLSV